MLRHLPPARTSSRALAGRAPRATATALALAGLLALAAPANATRWLQSGALGYPVPAGGAFSSVALGDVNGDGRDDLVENLSGAPNRFVVRLAGPDGVLGPEIVTTTPPGVIAYVTRVVDVNGDGKKDLVFADYGVGVMLGHGDGTFAPANFYSESLDWGGVAVGDLDGDGVPDVAEVAVPTDTLHVLHGVGDGSFVPAGAFPTPHEPYSVALGDMNGDGRLDAVTGHDSTFAVLLQQPDGSFGPALESGPGYSDVVLSDLDNDGKLDVASIDFVRFGNGDGSFGPAFLVGSGGLGVVAEADVDGDGLEDLVGYDYSPLGGAVAHNLGGRAFADTTYFGAALLTYYFASGDVNGDGRADVVAAPYTASYGVEVAFGNADGTVGGAGEVEMGASSAVALGDLDADGTLDLVTAGGSSLHVRRGAGGAQYGPRADLAGPAVIAALGLADLDGDGRSDAVTADADGFVSVRLAQPDGTLGSLTRFDMGSACNGLAIADLDSDTHPDVVVSESATSRLSLRLGTGGGAFGPRIDLPLASPPNCVAIADVTGDGIRDLVAGTNGSLAAQRTVALLRGTGGGNFAAATSQLVSAGPGAIAAGDLDNDGRADVLATNTNPGSGNLFVLRTTPSGTLGALVSYPDFGHSRAVGLGDLDRDGRLDVLVTLEYEGAVATMLGNGDATFGQRVDYAIGPRAFGMAQGDVNGDGLADVAVVNQSRNTVSMLLGISTGATSVDPGVPPSRLELAPRANPTVGDLAVRFALPAPGAARLELIDLAGRRLEGREVGGLGPGVHTVSLGDTRAFPPGLYFLRLARPGFVQSARVTILH